MLRYVIITFWIALCVLLGYDGVVLLENSSRWKVDELLTPIANHESTDGVGPSPQDSEWQPPEYDGLRFAACENTGIDFRYDNGAKGTFHLVETLGGGVAVTDFDRDRRPDLVFVNGGDFANWPEQTQNNIALYRNEGDVQFANVAESAACEWSGYGHGCAVGDFDNDGFDDLFFTGYQSTVLFHNRGDGTFEEVTDKAGLRIDRWCGTASFGDLDGDGDLDLYVTAYADVSRTAPPPYCELDGVQIHCHPHHYDAVPDLIFENLGDGRFADRSESSGVGAHTQYGLGVAMADFDHDRVPEIFVANDGDRNLMFEYRGNWEYGEIGVTAGVAYSGQGQSMGAMGIACSDFDGNGLLDLLTTTFIHEQNIVFTNLGNKRFLDNSLGTVIDKTSRPMVGWSAVSFDADSDGILDLFVANGHVTEWPGAPFRQPPMLYTGVPDGKWNAATAAGPYFERGWNGRGAVSADVTGDQRPDLIVCHIGDPASILKNDSVRRGNGFTLELIGVKSNRSASATRVVVEAGESRRVAQRMLSKGYLSSSTREMHFGLGDAKIARNVTIIWQSGVTQTLEDIPGGSSLLVIEGQPPILMRE